MTFIASIIAKTGVVLIADSLVTETRSVAEYEDFLKYIKDKTDQAKDKEIKIDPAEISALFKRKASHTKDYENKIFEYNKFMAITTAGVAKINEKRISALIGEAKVKLKPATPTNSKSTNKDKVIEEFKLFIESEVKEHLKNHSSIRPTVFIITHYSKDDNKTSIFKLEVLNSSQKDLEKEGHKFTSLTKQADHMTVVCDGQNRISERILFGDINILLELIFKVAVKMAEDFGIPQDKIDAAYLRGLVQNREIISLDIIEDIKITKLTELSIQQAVDLAALLMKIEIDIQKYTENIPTVGGVIKIAVIDEGGFHYIAGNTIKLPETV